MNKNECKCDLISCSECLYRNMDQSQFLPRLSQIFGELNRARLYEEDQRLESDKIDIGRRFRRILRDNNIRAVKDLTNYTAEDLYSIKGIGRKAIHEIKDLLMLYPSLKLKEKDHSNCGDDCIQ